MNNHLAITLHSLVLMASDRIRARMSSDRGDVPGWVLVTVMTAGLVTALWTVADGQLRTMLSTAISSVSRN